ncbi:MAG: transglutaminase domain-containing protein, partial [Microcystaceae cyanobacterium]
MTTEREYQEWQKRRRSAPRPSKSNAKYSPPRKKGFPFGWLFLGLGLGAAFLAFYGNPDSNPLKSLPKIQEQIQESPLVQQIFNPKTVITTRKVENPTPGKLENLGLENVQQLDAIAASLDYKGTSVQELALKLTAHAPTEAAKARIIYSWITQHIAYDVQMALTKNIDDLSPEGVLQRQQTICSGYANLYQAIAQAMGLEVVIIDGYSRSSAGLVGDDPEVNHAWNAVKINGNWYLLDATWGAGVVENQQFQQKFNPYYFATAPQQFVVNHFPRESKWQLFSPAYTRAQFDQLADTSPRFFQDQLQLVSHPQRSFQSNGNLAVLLEAPGSTLIAAQLKTNSGTELEKNYTLVQKKGSSVTVNVAFPAPGDYTLIIFSKQPGEETYRQAISYEIIANSASPTFPLTYG